MGARARSRMLGRFVSGTAAVVLGAGGLAACGAGTPASNGPGAHSDRVLLVGTYRGHPGAYRSIQAAVDAAKPGDWILVAPGDYHEGDDATHTPADPSSGDYGGVVITTSGLHLRGMNRTTTIVDGTNPSTSTPCSATAAEQDFGDTGSDGKPIGRNGIVVWKTDNVSIENLTVCNFLAGSGSSGNEVWWNGGAGSGRIGLSGYNGRYLTATSTYYGGEPTAAQYGIFASNAAGPATWDTLYASNFNDSGMYVGACLQRCDITIDHAWMEYSALGYSGTNSGGAVVIENSQFDHNQDGLDTNTQIGGDPPAPQNGECPGKATSLVTHTRSCWVFIHNDVHDNNDPNVPKAGSASAGPTGTGMTVSGGTNDTVMDNTFSNNGAWGILFVPYPDSSTPVLGQTCTGTGGVELATFGCVYDPKGDALLGNTFSNNGFFKNPSNSDFGQIVINGGARRNCFAGNRAPDGSSPADLEHTQPTCTGTGTTVDSGPLLAQVLCDTGFGTCPAGASYPQASGVEMQPLPGNLATMPDPCAGVPDNAWCRGGKPV